MGTRSENQQDRIEHGTDNNGEKSGTAKLTWNDVEFIRWVYGFGVTRTVIWCVVNNKTWRTNGTYQ